MTQVKKKRTLNKTKDKGNHGATGFSEEEHAAMREPFKELKSAASESEMLVAEKRIIENVKSGKRSMQ